MKELGNFIIPALILGFAWYSLLKHPESTRGPAQVIIPFLTAVYGAIFLGVLLHVPDWVGGVGIAIFAVAVPCVLVRCFAEAGWAQLARQYKDSAGFTGQWLLLRTFHMAPVSIDDAAYHRLKARFIGTMRVASGDDGLRLSSVVSAMPLLGLVFPPLRIPWQAVSEARFFEAPGWMPSANEPALLQLVYDPGFKGRFIELKVGNPPVYLQMPAELVANVIRQLPIKETQ